jgi:hypothetical protein
VLEELCRVYRCRRCGIEVRICVRCDDGQVYCAGSCRELARQQSLRAAAARYQSTRRGALHHAARQKAYRVRKTQHGLLESKVTHHPCAKQSGAQTVSAALETGEQPDGDADTHDADDVEAPRLAVGAVPRVFVEHCDFCQSRARQSGDNGPAGPVTSDAAGMASVGTEI